MRRDEWMAFVVNSGFPVTVRSKLCSRHFVPGVDYTAGNAQRRRLRHTAVPSLVSVEIIICSINNVQVNRDSYTLSLILLCTLVSLMYLLCMVSNLT